MIMLLGDALLERLEIKENAFVSTGIFVVSSIYIHQTLLSNQTQLNLPVRVKGGFLSKTIE